MRIEFDPDKDAANLAKHVVSLVFGAAVWADTDVLIVPTIRIEDGERRLRAVGLVGDRLDGGSRPQRRSGQDDLGEEEQRWRATLIP